jgi:predicted small metal-binding protein
MRRALLCGCGRHLEASDEDELFREVLAHLSREHSIMEHGKAQEVRQRVAAHSYRYELVEVYAGDAEPDEEFGLNPY